MPDFSGLELCRCIRADKTKSYTYVMVMASNQQENGVVDAMQAGADDFLMKPFNLKEMFARIGVGRRIIELHRKLEDKSAELEEIAGTDALTGLPNRRAIEEWANKQLRGAKRHGFPLWVVLGDLDCLGCDFARERHQYRRGDQPFSRAVWFALIPVCGTERENLRDIRSRGLRERKDQGF